MRKTFFSVFLCFAKDETDFFPYSNIHSKKYSGSVLAKVLQNKCGRKCETRSMEPLYENIRIYMSNTKITIIIVIFVCQSAAVNRPPSKSDHFCVLRLKTNVFLIKNERFLMNIFIKNEYFLIKNERFLMNIFIKNKRFRLKKRTF
jgi:hypothetical protein